MKKQTLLLFAILFCIAANSFGQKLDENNVDGFTKKSIKRTSWESLFATAGSGQAHYRFSVVDTSETFDLRYNQNSKIFGISEGLQFMFQLDNGDIVTLINPSFVITCTGCGATGMNGSGAEGIQVFYPISKQQSDKLKAGKVVKVRIYTNDGYIEEDVKDKNAEKITASLNLL